MHSSQLSIYIGFVHSKKIKWLISWKWILHFFSFRPTLLVLPSSVLIRSSLSLCFQADQAIHQLSSDAYSCLKVVREQIGSPMAPRWMVCCVAHFSVVSCGVKALVVSYIRAPAPSCRAKWYANDEWVSVISWLLSYYTVRAGLVLRVRYQFLPRSCLSRYLFWAGSLCSRLHLLVFLNFRLQ